MTPPQTKFFDKATHDWNPNDDILFIGADGKVYEFYQDPSISWGPDPIMKLRENIIAVPFTGLFDVNHNPLYLNDIGRDVLRSSSIRMHVIRRKNKVGFLLQSSYNSHKYAFSQRDASQLKIIGSSLTNPELLENE